MSDPVIEIKDIGPIEGPLTIPLHADGGVTILVGPNGIGKDQAITGIRRALGGKDPLTRRDGSKFGTVKLPGITLKVTSSVRKTGESEVVSIDGDLNYTDFVYPQIKDPAAADRSRIRLLCKLHNVKGDLAKFADLMGGQAALRDVASTKTLEAGDIDTMADSLARDLHKRKRELLDAAKKEEGFAAGCQEMRSEIGMTDEELQRYLDEEALQKAYDEAARDHTRLLEKQQAWSDAQKRIERASNTLSEARTRQGRITLEEATASFEKSKSAVSVFEREIAEVKTKLADLTNELDRAKHDMNAYAGQVDAAKSYSDLLAASEKALAEASAVECPEAPVVEVARAAVVNARADLGKAALARQAIEKEKEAKEHRAAAERFTEAAEDAMVKAKSVIEILAQSIGTGVLYLEPDADGNPRFMIEHPSRGATYFHELSDGERWIVAMLDAVEHLRGDDAEGLALFPIEQRAWEGLDIVNRNLIARAASRHKINVITAQASQEPTEGISVVPFDPTLQPPEQAA